MLQVTLLTMFASYHGKVRHLASKPDNVMCSTEEQKFEKFVSWTVLDCLPQ